MDKSVIAVPKAETTGTKGDGEIRSGIDQMIGWDIEKEWDRPWTISFHFHTNYSVCEKSNVSFAVFKETLDLMVRRGYCE